MSKTAMYEVFDEKFSGVFSQLKPAKKSKKKPKKFLKDLRYEDALVYALAYELKSCAKRGLATSKACELLREALIAAVLKAQNKAEQPDLVGLLSDIVSKLSTNQN